MNSVSKMTKFFAAVLTVGGLAGIAMGIWFAFQTVPQSGLYSLMLVPFIGLFVWSLYTGLRLWRGDRYGRKWGPVLFASQIPIIMTPAATVHWFTGAQFGPLLQFAGPTFHVSLFANFGVDGQFFYAPGGNETSFGINLFAAIALFCLLRSNLLLKSTRPRDTA